MNAGDVIDEAAGRRIVLLGEIHEQAEHQRWALHTIAALHGRRPNLVLGFEMFPRRAQPVLDRWVAGELDERAFLQAVEWDRVWGHDPAAYMPLFHFARANRVNMVALNVDRDVAVRVRREGMARVPRDAREGVGDPASARPADLDRLAEAYRQLQDKPSATRPALDDPQFLRFVDAQLLWDRAMAEALDRAARANQGRPVVGVMGRGHLEHRDGVPAQLAALGRKDSHVLLAWTGGPDCAPPQRGVADAVFVVAPLPAPLRLRLGVRLEPHAEGARVSHVAANSVAAASGIAVGDVVTTAAGEAISSPGALSRVLRRQAPGTWLPLVVRRDGRALDLVARF
ncbi:MAG: ChaN family lipoprotein [Rhodospirillales bacterium]